MRCAAHGDTVRVHFTGRFTEGSVVTTTEGMSPIQIEIGQGKAIKGLEKGLVGMRAGDRKTIEVLPRDGFGEHQDSLVAEIRKELLPKGMIPEVGMTLKMNPSNGDAPVEFQIQEIGTSTVTLDGNHPLAGHTLVFEVELIEILDPA
jgi:peptidylprolyl isomerase